jgi:predicted transcriptional regulator
MDLSLEQCRDHWLNAFYTGQVQELMIYEHPEFKVVYEAQGKVESNLSRYACIQHAVQNGVWKPRHLDIQTEIFEFNPMQTECRILLHLAQPGQVVQETWSFQADAWQIIELRFCKKKLVGVCD